MINETSNYYIPAILIISFNRPVLTARILDRVREVTPCKIYLACDGPRKNNSEDILNIEKIISIYDAVDWCPEVNTLISSTNLGCARAVSEAVTWFMSEAGEGIILEDDCLPDASFFRFCGELLKKYRDDYRVMQISGFNYLNGMYSNNYDYLFSHYGWQWGWATWKRAWDYFDLNISTWPMFKRLGHHKYYPFYKERNDVLDRTHEGLTSAWSYQWHYAMDLRMGVSVIPNKSLISNIGFGEGATHGRTVPKLSTFHMAASTASFPINHCPFVYADKKYDDMSVGTYLSSIPRQSTRTYLSKMFRKIVKNG